MEWNPYISGALTAIIYFTAFHSLSKKLKNWKRYVIAIVIGVCMSGTGSVVADRQRVSSINSEFNAHFCVQMLPRLLNAPKSVQAI